MERLLPSDYRPDAMERVGRKLKMEYVGMSSVFLLLWLVDFRGVPHWTQSALATAGTFFLFMGVKKKTRDHLVTSLLLFAAAALAVTAVTELVWVLPYALFGACAWAMEGYLEKRRGRIFALPAILGGFAWTSPFWPLALLFLAAYLLEPRAEAPGLRKRLARLVVVSGLAGLAVSASAPWRDGWTEWQRHPPDLWQLALLALFTIPVLSSLVAYRGRLARPHLVNGLLFGFFAPFDERCVALFGMVGAIVLAATVFKESADSPRWRHALKHLEWYFFPLVTVAALSMFFFGP
jgi:hypothetical protein